MPRLRHGATGVPLRDHLEFLAGALIHRVMGEGNRPVEVRLHLGVAGGPEVEIPSFSAGPVS